MRDAAGPPPCEMPLRPAGAACAGSCVTMQHDQPGARAARAAPSRRARRSAGSSAPVGSSSRSTGGVCTKARMRASRCRSPVDRRSTGPSIELGLEAETGPRARRAARARSGEMRGDASPPTSRIPRRHRPRAGAKRGAGMARAVLRRRAARSPSFGSRSATMRRNRLLPEPDGAGDRDARRPARCRDRTGRGRAALRSRGAMRSARGPTAITAAQLAPSSRAWQRAAMLGSSARRISRSGCAPGRPPGRSPSAGCRCRGSRRKRLHDRDRAAAADRAPPGGRIPRSAASCACAPSGCRPAPRWPGPLLKVSMSNLASAGLRSLHESAEALHDLVRVLAGDEAEGELGPASAAITVLLPGPL